MGNVQYVLTPHASERMGIRRISNRELEELLYNPDEVMPQGPKLILSKTFLARTDNDLAAVILPREEVWIVITVMVNFQKS